MVQANIRNDGVIVTKSDNQSTHLKPILITSELKIEKQIEKKLYIFFSVDQLRQISTLERQVRGEAGLWNSSLDELLVNARVAEGLVVLDEGVHVVARLDLFPVQPVDQRLQFRLADSGRFRGKLCGNSIALKKYQKIGPQSN